MLTKTKGQVTPFGGIHIVHQLMLGEKISTFIDNALGQRACNASYRYSDLVMSRCYTALCGGQCAEDIGYVGHAPEALRDLKPPSPDTILAMERELSTPAEEITTRGGSINKVNVNTGLNDLLIGMALKLGVLEGKSTELCLDFDHQFIPCEKYDTTYSYKNRRGYFPAVASIGNVPVQVENRNGNCHVKPDQLSTLRRVVAQLGEHGVRPAYCRMDSGSYIKEVCDHMEKEHITFCIRAEQSDTLLFNASMNGNWQQCEIGNRNHETCSIDHRFGEHDHRMVCYRWPNSTGQTRTITGDANSYLFIITNDRTKSEKQIIEFYNARGNSERLFDIQNNDFNWNSLPSSTMEYNTVYMIIMAICHIIYRWLIGILSKACPFLQPHHRLRKFTFRLICIAARIVRTGRRKVINLYTDLPIDLAGLSP